MTGRSTGPAAPAGQSPCTRADRAQGKIAAMPLRQYVVTYTARFSIDDTSVKTELLGTTVFDQDGGQASDEQDLDAKSLLMNAIGEEVPMADVLRQFLGLTFHSVEPVIAEVLAQHLPVAQLFLPGSTDVQEEVTWYAKGEPGFDQAPPS